VENEEEDEHKDITVPLLPLTPAEKAKNREDSKILLNALLNKNDLDIFNSIILSFPNYTKEALEGTYPKKFAHVVTLMERNSLTLEQQAELSERIFQGTTTKTRLDSWREQQLKKLKEKVKELIYQRVQESQRKRDEIDNTKIAAKRLPKAISRLMQMFLETVGRDKLSLIFARFQGVNDEAAKSASYFIQLRELKRLLIVNDYTVEDFEQLLREIGGSSIFTRFII
jgi:hypothetical protein